jgi:chemotaxis protein MotB
MARRKKHEEHENHERWLVSYADFITLLFAFFTVLYATSQTDQEKLEAVINGLNAAFEGGMPHAMMEVMSFQENPPDLPDMVPNHLITESAEPLIQTIRRNLAGSLSDNVVQVGLVDQTLTLVLPERLLFARGSAELHPSAYSVLSEVSIALAGQPVSLEVTGHADGLPVSGPPFEDNWGLSSARALSVVRYMQRHRMKPEQMIASGSVVTEENSQARAVTLRIRVVAPAASAEVADAIDPESRRAAAMAAARSGEPLPEPVPVPAELVPDTPRTPRVAAPPPTVETGAVTAAPASALPAAAPGGVPTPAASTTPGSPATGSPTSGP